MRIVLFLVAFLQVFFLFAKELVDSNFFNWQKANNQCSFGPGKEITISATDAKKDLYCAFLPKENFSQGALLSVSFNVICENIVSGRPDYRWSAPVLTAVAIDNTGKRKTLLVRAFDRGSNPGQKFYSTISVPEKTKMLRIAFNLRNCSGKVTFKDLSIKVLEQKISEKIYLKSFLLPKGGYLTKVERFPNKNIIAPKLNKNETLSFFKIDIPRQTFDVNLPEQNQLTDKFSAFSVPGELGSLFIGLYTEKAINNVAIKVNDLKDSAGNVISSSNIQIKRAHNWAQAGDRGQRLSYYVVPELLLEPSESPNLPEKTSAMYMVKVKVPKNCVPGIYRGNISFIIPNVGVKNAKIAFKVFPVKIEHPSPDKFVTIGHIGAYGDKKEKMVELCCELKERGFEGILIACHYGKGRIQLEKKNNKLAIKSFDRLDHAVAGYLAAGMKGVFIIHLSDQLEVAVARAIGVPENKIPKGMESTKFIPGMDTVNFKNAYLEALALIRERCKGIKNIVIMGLDEPYGARIPRSKWEMDLIRKAGYKVGFYGDEKTWFPLEPDFMVSASRFHSKEFKQVKAACEKKNVPYLQYGGSGSYGYAYGGLMPSRATHGWGAYLNGVKGYTAWTFYAIKPLNMKTKNYLDTWATLIHITPENKLLYTLQYEGISEGIADYAWINTLEQSLKKNSQKPVAKKIKVYFEQLKKDMRKRLSDRLTAEPSVSPEDVPPELHNYQADELRLLLISWIMELEK